MVRSHSFRYDANISQSDYLLYFDELANKFSMRLVEKCTTERRFFVEADISQAIEILGIELQEYDLQNGPLGLTQECTACLTRIVTYTKLVYRNTTTDLELEVNCCEQNDFPVLGIDLWEEGCSALPGGMLVVNGQDTTVVAQLIDAFRRFRKIA